MRSPIIFTLCCSLPLAPQPSASANSLLDASHHRQSPVEVDTLADSLVCGKYNLPKPVPTYHSVSSQHSQLRGNGTNKSPFKATLGTKPKALVTGAAGFIGSHVTKDCARLGFTVVAVDDLSGGFRRNLPQGAEARDIKFIVGDLKDAKFVSKLFEDEKFDVVFHIAAYAAEGLSHFIRSYNYRNNLVASTNLITQSVRTKKVKRFVFTSSIAVYGSGRTPMSEDLAPMPEDP